MLSLQTINTASLNYKHLQSHEAIGQGPPSNLAVEPVGIAEPHCNYWPVGFAQIDLEIIDPRTDHLIRSVPSP